MGVPERFKVTAYLGAGQAHSFPARSQNHAREIASRIIQEGLWVILPDGSEEYYPVCRVFKVKIEKAD